MRHLQLGVKEANLLARIKLKLPISLVWGPSVEGMIRHDSTLRRILLSSIASCSGLAIRGQTRGRFPATMTAFGLTHLIKLANPGPTFLAVAIGTARFGSVP